MEDSDRLKDIIRLTRLADEINWYKERFPWVVSDSIVRNITDKIDETIDSLKIEIFDATFDLTDKTVSK